MPDAPYSNRELDEKLANVSILIREKHDDVMIAVGEVRVQTTYTNGRVRWLEKMLYLGLGGLGVITMVMLPLLWALIESGKI